MLKSDAFYKIIPEANLDMDNTESCIKLMPLDISSGFTHVSFGRQVMGVVQKFFKSAGLVLVVELDLDFLQKQGIELRVESNKPGGEKYPHLYGVQKIPVYAVKRILRFKEQPDGSWTFLESKEIK
ncbi:MAG: DUF952 domain-containing protein [bacterium]